MERRVVVMALCLRAALRPQATRQGIESVVGKLNFCFGFSPHLRSVLFDVYHWIEKTKEKNLRVAPLWHSVRGELLVAAIMLPAAQTCLDAPWCPRAECMDAAPGGHGRAWARLPQEVVEEMARWGDQRLPATNLHSEAGICLDDEGRCLLMRFRLPPNVKWHTLP